MSNVTVQEALKAAIGVLERAYIKESEHPWCKAVDETINKCKAALAEIDKCEPVIGLENGQILWSKMPSEYTGSLYTSPQPLKTDEKDN